MVSIELSESISETLDILKHMKKTDIDKIPKDFLEFLENNQSKDYVPNLDHSKKMNEMNLKEKTKVLLASIYLNYWCDNDAKEEYKKILIENDRKHQEELKKINNPDNLFKKKQLENKNEVKIANDSAEMVKYKESFLSKIINRIKKIFHIN